MLRGSTLEIQRAGPNPTSSSSATHRNNQGSSGREIRLYFVPKYYLGYSNNPKRTIRDSNVCQIYRMLHAHSMTSEYTDLLPRPSAQANCQSFFIARYEV